MATPWITESTDVMNDPRYLMSVAQGHGRQARFARERLKELQQERQFQAGHEQQASQFAAAHAQQERQRQDALTESARRHDETLGQQKLAQQQLEAYRQVTASQTEEARRFQRATGLLNLAQSNLELSHGANAPAIRKALYDQYYAEMQGGGQPQTPVATAPAPAPATSPATGAAPAATGLSSLAPQTADPKAGKVTEFLANQNEPGVTPPAGQPQAAGGTANFSPGTLASDRLVNTRDANTGVARVVPGSQAYDFNSNTAEYVPHNMEGSINGQPAGQLLAHMTARSGRTPESTSGQAAFQSAKVEAGNRQVGEATTPPMDIPIPEPPRVGGNQPHTAMDFGEITAPGAPQQPQAPAPVAAAPAAPSPVVPEQIPTNPAGEPQYPSGAMSSGLHSGAWLAEQFKQLPISVGQPSQDALAQELKRRQQMPGY